MSIGIAGFIADSILTPRLRQTGCLVVYDTYQRYRDICLGLASDTVRVVDTSESSIESREVALVALREVGESNVTGKAVLVYVPAKKPETDEAKQVDPFAIYAECGTVFPHDDGDEYLSLCLRAKPDRTTEIRRVFADTPGGPSFAVIDAIGSGGGWPQLRAVLGVESAREILCALLAPTETQTGVLKGQEGWQPEARDFLHAALSLTLKTRGKTWNAIADEVWRFVLFSEFVFDLPVALPEALQGVPHAPVEAKPVTEDVCHRLRTEPRSSSVYIERAQSIEAELNLPELCSAVEDLGEKDTFPFEERTFLKRAIKGITSDAPDVAHSLLARHEDSVWMGKGENRSQWDLVRAALSLVEACVDFERQVPEHVRSLDSVLDFYVGSLREVDRCQREFEQATSDCFDASGVLVAVITTARARYRHLTEKVQAAFVKHVEAAGWPPAGRMSNAESFDRLVADYLKENGRRVAYIMVDALRYELGIALQRQLTEEGTVEIQAAYAQLPSITLVGMAALLPGAKSGLSLALENGGILPRMNDVPVVSVLQRMSFLKKQYGDRFSEALLGDFARGKSKTPDTVDLLVLRSGEIDSEMEATPEMALSIIPNTLKLIRVAVHKLRAMGFDRAVIVTDHGFFLNTQAEAGDICAKPSGTWSVNAHDRMLLGDGTSDSNNVVMGADRLGIRGDFAQAAFPRSMAPYGGGHIYFHGGVSLQEVVVPIIVVKLETGTRPPVARMSVKVSYKSGAKKITTRLPVLELLLTLDDLFAQVKGIDVLLEAQDARGNVVGETRPGSEVNPADRTVRLVPGQVTQVILGMDPAFEGKFAVKALDPTTLAAYDKIDLETDYLV